MNANRQIEAFSEPSEELAEAFYFGTDQQLFGWLHRSASAQACDMGLVICNPFGYEAICSHRSVRAFAEAAAAIGVVSLRFDYRGTGDSADIDPNADQIEVWSARRRHGGIGASQAELASSGSACSVFAWVRSWRHLQHVSPPRSLV